MRLFTRAIFALATNVAAQDGPRPNPPQPPGPGTAALRQYLNLSGGQLDRMISARQQAQRQAEEKSRGIEAQARETHMALQALLERPASDPAAIGKAMLELRAVEKQMSELHESVRAAALAILTSEQRAKFRAIEDAALLPAATREAAALGLAHWAGMQPGIETPQGPRPPMINQPMGPRPQGQPRAE